MLVTAVFRAAVTSAAPCTFAGVTWAICSIVGDSTSGFLADKKNKKSTIEIKYNFPRAKRQIMSFARA